MTMKSYFWASTGAIVAAFWGVGTEVEKLFSGKRELFIKEWPGRLRENSAGSDVDDAMTEVVVAAGASSNGAEDLMEALAVTDTANKDGIKRSGRRRKERRQEEGLNGYFRRLCTYICTSIRRDCDDF